MISTPEIGSFWWWNDILLFKRSHPDLIKSHKTCHKINSIRKLTSRRWLLHISHKVTFNVYMTYIVIACCGFFLCPKANHYLLWHKNEMFHPPICLDVKWPHVQQHNNNTHGDIIQPCPCWSVLTSLVAVSCSAELVALSVLDTRYYSAADPANKSEELQSVKNVNTPEGRTISSDENESRLGLIGDFGGS